jgi:hypothetical protein
MADPAFKSAGTAAESLTTSIAVPHPTGIVANDLLILHVLSKNLVDIATPAGWSQDATNGMKENVTLHSEWFWKRAVGGETGTVTVTRASGTDLFQGIMYRFTDVITTGTPYESLNVVGTTSSTTLSPADVMTTGTRRCIVVLSSIENDPPGSLFVQNSMSDYRGGTVTVWENDERGTGTGTDATLHCASVPR